jgi:hypothetical protein
VEIKCQLDATDVFNADLIACSTCFGYHLVGILFPHINDDARSKSLQIIAVIADFSQRLISVYRATEEHN